MPETTPRTARTTETSFRVIEALDAYGRAGVTTIAEELDLAKGTVHKHLTTLESIGYVVKENRQYRLGVKFLGLGVSTRRRLDVYTAGQDPIERLAEATEEVASLMIPEHGYGTYLYRVPGDDQHPLPHHDGEHVHLHSTAGGKAILAYLPAEARESILNTRGTPAMTDRTITARSTLENTLRTAHDTRVAYDRGEEVAGWHCVASPITNVGDEAIGAVTLSAESSFTGDTTRGQDIPGLVVSTARAIENKINFA